MPNIAFEPTVTRQRWRAASVGKYLTPAARYCAPRAAAQRAR